MNDIRPEFQELALKALDLALDCFSAGEHNPFILFVDESGQGQLVEVKDTEGNVNDKLVEMARQMVAETIGTKAQRYAIAYDGYITIDGERTDAAFVEAGERGDPEAFLIAQRYRVKKRSKKPEKRGKPLITGPGRQLLGESDHEREPA